MRRLLALLLVLAAPLAGAVTVLPEMQPQAKDAREHPGPRANRSRPIGLPAPTASERGLLGSAHKGEPTRIGFGRALQVDERHLDWEALPDGAHVASVAITSPGASALRVEVDARAPALLRFTGNGETFESAATNQPTWSPVVEGDTITVEIELPAGERTNGVRFSITRLSHLEASASNAFALPEAKAAAACTLDATCQAGTWGPEMNAVARMVFTSGSSSYLCTGTLMADDDPNTLQPYFLTANHCIGSQAVASTLVTYWFYRSSACNSGTVGAYRTLQGGATLLFNSTTTDVSFMKLNAAPPPGAVYAGWTSDPVALGTTVTGLHHPTGDLLKYSNGTISTFLSCSTAVSGQYSCSLASPAGSGFYEVEWTRGVVQGGSSGSALFSDDGQLVIGQLYGGASTCTNLAAGDEYGRLDVSLRNGLSRWLAAGPSYTGPAWPVAGTSTLPDGFVPLSAGWSLVSGAPGVETYEGTQALRANAIGNGGVAGVAITARFAGGSVAFARRVSSLQGSGILRFAVDGVTQGTWSGEVPWALATYPLAAGPHTLAWIYEKGASGSAGQDTAWIDAVALPAASALASVTIAKSGDGQGVVTSDPPGLACGDACTATFGNAATVTIFGTGVAGARLEALSCSSQATTGAETCTVSLTDSASINATFTQLAGQHKKRLRTSP